MLKFILGLALGLVVGWLAFGESTEPDISNAELIEVEVLD